MREAIIFRIALAVSAAIHIGGFGLLWNGNHSFLQNGFGDRQDNIIVFEIGEISVKNPQGTDRIMAGAGPESASTISSTDICSAVSHAGSSGLDRENLGGIRDDYLLRIRRCIEQAKFYPREARRRLISGSVTLSFCIDVDGSVKDTRIIKSSGFSILDRTAKEIILKANPFPKPPEGERYVQVTIVFTLGSNSNRG